MTSLRRPATSQKGRSMSQSQSAARTQHRLKARLKSLTARPAVTALVAAGMLAGSAGTAVIATSSPAAAPVPMAAYIGCSPTQLPQFVPCGAPGTWR
jgi:hypothetical protein